jgi:hypothetical protein
MRKFLVAEQSKCGRWMNTGHIYQTVGFSFFPVGQGRTNGQFVDFCHALMGLNEKQNNNVGGGKFHFVLLTWK